MSDTGTFLCARFGIGPRCLDDRFEINHAKKRDCIKRAYLSCTSTAYSCYATHEKVEKYVQPAKVVNCQNEHLCFDTRCLYGALKDCYCLGLSGLTCRYCPAIVEPLFEEASGIGDALDEDDDSDFADGFDDGEDEFDVEKNVGATGVAITISEADGPIPIVWGTLPLGGNIIWINESSTKTLTVVNDIGGKLTEETKEVGVIDMAVSLSTGVVDKIDKIWIGDKLVIDKTVSADVVILSELEEIGFEVEFFRGTESQNLSTTMAEATPFGRTPAYRDMSYMVIKNFPIDLSAMNIPSLRIQVSSSGNLSNPVSFVEGDHTDQESDSLSVDPATELIVTSSGTDIKLSNSQDLTASKVIAAPNIVTNTLTASEDGSGFVYQATDNSINHIVAQHPDIVRTLPSSVVMDSFTSYTASTPELGRFAVIFGTSGSDVYMYRASLENDEFTLVNTLLGSSLSPVLAATTFSRAVIDNYYPSVEGFPDTRAYFVTQDTSNAIRVLDYQIEHKGILKPILYDETRTLSQSIISIGGLGLSSPAAILKNVLSVKGQSSFILFFDDAGTDKAVKISPRVQDTSVWITEIDGIPDGRLYAKKGSTVFKYVANGGTYTLNLEDGSFRDEEILVSDFSGSQYYNQAKDAVITIDASNNIAKAKLGAIPAGDAVTLSEVLYKIFKLSGIDSPCIEVFPFGDIIVDGYMIKDQPVARESVLELAEFYNIEVLSGGRGIRGQKLYNQPVYDVQDAYLTPSYNKLLRVDNDDKPGYATVGYFDSDADFDFFSQTANINSMRDRESEYLPPGGLTYSLNVYTDKDTARTSVEESLLKRLAVFVKREAHLAPRWLEVEAGDLITMDGVVSTKIHNLVLSPDNAASIIGRETRGNSPVPVPLKGFSPPAVVGGGLEANIPDTLTKSNYPVRVYVPTPEVGASTDALHYGQISPYSAFIPNDQYIRGANSDVLAVKPPTVEAVVGVLSGVLGTTTAEFSTDRVNTLTVKFNKDISGKFTQSTLEDMYVSGNNNLLAVGRELVQFRDFAVEPDNVTVTFSVLMRGKFGTDNFMHDHNSGEQVVYMDEAIESVFYTR